MSRARRIIISDEEEEVQLVNNGEISNILRGVEAVEPAENEARPGPSGLQHSSAGGQINMEPGPGPSGLQHSSAGGQINMEPDELSITLIDIIILFYSYGLISITLWQEALRRAEEKVMAHPSIKIKSIFQILKIYIQGLRTRVMIPHAYDDNQMGILDVLHKTLPCSEILVGAKGLSDSDKPQFLKSDVDEIWNYMKVCNRKRTIEDVFNEEAIPQREPFTYSQSIEIKLNDKQFLAWTPAKKGKYLVRLELFETDDIEGLSFKDRYKRVKTKLEMVINENDERFELINDIISLACDNLKTENGYKKVVRPVAKVSPMQQKN
ncbi:uncharacterized protein LOC142331666 [Lycorma delicatula]|uniref:uncharacterized protein LOC142331666 n=1 Tax=Lycorma delicatula TaxID=130591 RepID=UPI003F514357